MTGLSWRLVHALSLALDRDERLVVLGDLSESNPSLGHAVRDVVGLVVRRRLEPWAGWSPWLALLGIAVPVSIVLSHVSRLWSEGGATYVWLLAHQTDLVYFADTVWATGGRGVPRFAVWFALNALTLIAWSWASGRALASLSREGLWVTGPLLYLGLVFGTLGSDSVGRVNNLELFSRTLYGSLLPAVQRVVLVVLPALCGMYAGVRSPRMARSRAIVAAVVIGLLTWRAAFGLEVSVVASWWPLIARDSWLLSLLPFVVAWPIGYLVVSAGWPEGERGPSLT